MMQYVSKASANKPTPEDLELLNAYDGTEITASEYIAPEAAYAFLNAHGPTLWPNVVSERGHLTMLSSTPWNLPSVLQNSTNSTHQ